MARAHRRGAGRGDGTVQAFDEACAARDGVELLAGEALADARDATTLRTRGGRLQMTDGPYAEVIEGMGGFYLVEAPDLDVWSSCSHPAGRTTCRSRPWST